MPVERVFAGSYNCNGYGSESERIADDVCEAEARPGSFIVVSFHFWLLVGEELDHEEVEGRSEGGGAGGALVDKDDKGEVGKNTVKVVAR